MSLPLKKSVYKINLGNASFEQTIVSLLCQHRLDGYSTLELSLALPPTRLKSLSVRDYPNQVDFSWDDKAIFNGYLLSARIVDAQRMSLTFVDGLYFATKKSGNQFHTQQTLRDTLQKLLSSAGLDARFKGNFSEVLSGFQQGGGSVLEVVAHLSEKHGFSFVLRPGQSQVVCFKTGEAVESKTLNMRQVPCTPARFRQSAHASFQKVHFRYFDANHGQARESSLSSEQLYGPIGVYTGESAFRDKMQWKASGGTMETYVTDKHHFEGAQSLFPAQFSKQAMQQEGLSLGVFEPIALVGDKLRVSESQLPAIQDGSYLVSSCEISVVAAAPKMTLTAVRA